MADVTAAEMAPARTRPQWPLVLGAGLALAGGAAGFYASYAGLVLGGADHGEPAPGAEPLPDIAFVPVDPLVLSLGRDARSQHLRFSAELEVTTAHAAEVALLMPRILDVLNGYLRAVEVAELEDRAALVRLRAQMLRRIQIVTGEGRVRDLLISEFVLN